MSDQEICVRISVSTAELGKQLRDIISSSEGFRVHSEKEANQPDLLIFELSENFDKEFKLIESLLASNAVGEVFVTYRKAESDLLLRALRIGVKEFLSQPLGKEELKEALASVKRRKQQQVSAGQPPLQGEIIYVMGSKGGVGTTTVAVNLAMKFSENKTISVALVDMNSVFGEVPLFLSIKPTYHWGEIVESVNRLDTTFLMNVLARHPSGVHILPSPSYLNGYPPAIPETMGRLLTLMKKTFDYVIIDGGQSLEAPSLKAIEMSDKVLFITLLNLPCLANMNKVFKSLSNIGIKPKDRFKIIINRFVKQSDISLKEAGDSVRSEIFWTIPNDYKKTMSAINQGKALQDIAPRAPITKNIAALVDLLRADGEVVKEKKGWSLFKKNSHIGQN
jgi:pilus assembly protein CpaE